MKSKLFSFVFLTAILAVLAMSVAFAASSFNTVSTIQMSKSVNQTSFSITNPNQTNDVTVIVPSTLTISDGKGHNLDLDLNPNGNILISNASSASINISYLTSPSFVLGKFSNSFTVYNAANSSDSKNITVEFSSGYCNKGRRDRGAESLEIIKIEDKSSDDEWKWKPGDSVDIDVKVRYNSDDNDDSIDAIIKIGLYDTVSKSFIEFENDDDSEAEISLDEGTSETQSFSLDVPIDDVEDSSDRYKLYVKVYEDGKESTLCEDVQDRDVSQAYENVKITKESYSVIVKNIETNTPVPCGEQATIDFTVWNVGSHDEDKVYVKAYHRDLGFLNLTSSTFSLDEGDSKKVSFDFIIPINATSKPYDFYITTYFRYSDSSKEFKKYSTESYLASIKVENCVVETRTASITAELSSETPRAVIGNQVIVEATIKNTGSVQSSFTVDVSGNTGWSNVAEIDPKTFTLNAGESKKVNIYLDINADAAAGDQSFTIRTAQSGYVTEQKVQLTLEKGFSSSALINHFKENWLIYLIVLVNIILILAIIIVVRSIVRKNSD